MRIRRRAFETIVTVGIMAIIAAIAAVAVEQTLKPREPFTVAWEHDGVDAAFRLWCGPNVNELAIIENFTTARLSKSATANAQGLYTFTATTTATLPFGNHQCLVSAYNALGEAKGAPIPVLVGSVPNAPQGLRLVQR